MFREKIEKLVKNSVDCLAKENCISPQKIEIVAKHPPKEEYGDYSVALRQDLAKQVREKIKKNPPKFLEKVEFLPPSFLNFYIKKDYFKKAVGDILKNGEKFGKVNIGKKKRANVEFISANPTGPLHIGNGRGAFFGDVLSNLLSFSDFKVEREFYVNDAKTSQQIRELGRTAIGKGNTYLTDDLRIKIKRLDKKLSPIRKKFEANYIIDAKTNILDKDGVIVKSEISSNKELGEAGYLLAQEVLKDIKKLAEKKLKIKFNKWFFEEKNLLKKKRIEKTLDILKKKKLTYKKEEALWLKTSKYGDIEDRVLVRSNGQPTYFLSDIAYHIDKIKRGYKKIVDIWGADHHGYIKRMKAAMHMLGYKGEFEVLISQIVNLKGGEKMSKRRGNIVYLEDLVNEIGLDIARYFYISKSLSSQMEFDLKLAKEQSEKNPVYYIQYAYVRAQSVIKKSKKARLRLNLKNLKLLNHKSEFNLIKELIKFPEIIEDTVGDYQLHRLTEYARDLASNFNQFYRDCKVLDKEKGLAEARLSLVFATKIVLSNLLSLMGISRPEKM